jgi:hypothetical protein
MYVFGQLDDDDNPADWKDEDFDARKELNSNHMR